MILHLWEMNSHELQLSGEPPLGSTHEMKNISEELRNKETIGGRERESL